MTEMSTVTRSVVKIDNMAKPSDKFDETVLRHGHQMGLGIDYTTNADDEFDETRMRHYSQWVASIDYTAKS